MEKLNDTLKKLYDNGRVAILLFNGSVIIVFIVFELFIFQK
jgi:hypothetical protein